MGIHFDEDRDRSQSNAYPVLTKTPNAPAYAFYAKAGFAEFSSQLEKKL